MICGGFGIDGLIPILTKYLTLGSKTYGSTEFDFLSTNLFYQELHNCSCLHLVPLSLRPRAFGARSLARPKWRREDTTFYLFLLGFPAVRSDSEM
jgi:hypothetical protein